VQKVKEQAKMPRRVGSEFAAVWIQDGAIVARNFRIEPHMLVTYDACTEERMDFLPMDFAGDWFAKHGAVFYRVGD